MQSNFTNIKSNSEYKSIQWISIGNNHRKTSSSTIFLESGQQFDVPELLKRFKSEALFEIVDIFERSEGLINMTLNTPFRYFKK